VGLYVVNRLLQVGLPPWVSAIPCGEVPENYISDILAHDPSHVIIIDGAVAGLAPGTIVLIESDEIWGRAISTHALPLSIFSKMIASQTEREVDVFVLGVQVERCDFGEELTSSVERAGDSVSEALAKAVRVCV
jgi:hydrogenase maturation protease